VCPISEINAIYAIYKSRAIADGTSPHSTHPEDGPRRPSPLMERGRLSVSETGVRLNSVSGENLSYPKCNCPVYKSVEPVTTHPAEGRIRPIITCLGCSEVKSTLSKRVNLLCHTTTPPRRTTQAATRRSALHAAADSQRAGPIVTLISDHFRPFGALRFERKEPASRCEGGEQDSSRSAFQHSAVSGQL
jgi:hypothetical protein